MKEINKGIQNISLYKQGAYLVAILTDHIFLCQLSSYEKIYSLFIGYLIVVHYIFVFVNTDLDMLLT